MKVFPASYGYGQIGHGILQSISFREEFCPSRRAQVQHPLNLQKITKQKTNQQPSLFFRECKHAALVAALFAAHTATEISPLPSSY